MAHLRQLQSQLRPSYHRGPLNHHLGPVNGTLGSHEPRQPSELITTYVSSPAHSPKVFHCSLYFAALENDKKVSQLMRYFLPLSGLLQHLESGACQEAVQLFERRWIHRTQPWEDGIAEVAFAELRTHRRRTKVRWRWFCTQDAIVLFVGDFFSV